MKIISYEISVAKNYPNFNLKKDDIYYVNYKLLFKCNKEVWEKNYQRIIYHMMILLRIMITLMIKKKFLLKSIKKNLFK